LTSDENNQSADEAPDIEDEGKNTSLPLAPQIEIPEPKRENFLIEGGKSIMSEQFSVI